MSEVPTPEELATNPRSVDYAAMQRQLDRIEASQIETATLVKQFIDGIKPAVEEMLPKIQAIGESSWFRMISGGKKR
jgi:hypothetical protein